MKQLIFLVCLAVIGYFAYQHFFIAPQQEVATEEEDTSLDSGSFSFDQLPPTPDNCKGLAKNLENAIYGSASARVSFAQRNMTYRKFQSCLRDAGFSDSEIDGTIAEIESRVEGYLKHDRGP